MRTSRQMIISLALATALTVASAEAGAQDALLGDSKALPASIHKVEAGGYWSRGKEEGFFRVVVVAGGVEHVVHRLYLQWLAVDPDSQKYRVVRTIPVREINKGHGSVLEVKSTFADLGRLKVAITARRRGGGPAKRFVLTAQADGTYSLRTP
jgi:hypothetical protein